MKKTCIYQGCTKPESALRVCEDHWNNRWEPGMGNGRDIFPATRLYERRTNRRDE